MNEATQSPAAAQPYSSQSDLFARNRAWAESKTSSDPTFFSRLVDQQRPRYFWIGCSDSRVPAAEIVDPDPGEMFVHRNVANLAVEYDRSFTAALQFAVKVLEVRHIMIVGHYGCGGIQAAMDSETDDAPALCEANVAAQIAALAVNPVVRDAWAHGRDLTLHGWAYGIDDGLLREVCPPVRESPDYLRQARP